MALSGLIAAAPAAADWTAPVEISDAGTRNASNLQIDANPGRVAAWNYASGVAVVTPMGGSAPPTQTYAGDYGAPTVGIGGSGAGALAFQSTAGNPNYAIYAASKPGNSNMFGGATAIYGPGTESATGHPILAVNGMDTAQLFHDIGNVSSCCVHPLLGRLLTDPEENTWSAGTEFSATASETHNRVVGTATDGSTVLLYKINNGLGARAIVPAVIENDGTTSRGAAIDASSGNGPGALSNPSGISVARMPDASVVAAVARKEGTGGGIFVQDFSKGRAAGSEGGTPPETRISGDEDGSQPKVATDGAGNSIATWYDPSDGGADANAIRARFRAAGSPTWGSVETVATGNLGALDLAVDALGNAFVVYVDEAADAVKARIRKPGATGAWGAPETLSSGLSGVESPHVAAVAGYEAFAAFTADNGVGAAARAVYAATGDATPKVCEDGVDNDGDGLTDHPADPGCSSPDDADESNPPPASGPPPAAGASPAAGGGVPPTGGSGVGSKPMIRTACGKASERLAKANKQFKKANRTLKKRKRRARNARGKKQLKKAKKQLKKLKKNSKKAKRAKRRACR